MNLSVAQWAQVETTFAQAVERDPDDRRRLLEGLEPAVRSEVEAMLAAVDRGGDFLSCAATVVAIGPTPSGRVSAGARLGPWRVLHLVGRGGMGEVYEAERDDGQFEQRVAIKFLSYDSGQLLQRFQLERQILARLDHPGIARLFDGGVSPDGQPYAVMEFVVGQPITEWVDARAASLQERLRLFLQVCDAVAHAHKNLIVHRDLKPANILVDTEGRVRLLDFGIAKVVLDVTSVEAAEAPNVKPRVVDGKATNPALAPFTPEYAAPEQLMGGPITTATDVHALGLLLFELLTGVRARGAARATQPLPLDAPASQVAALQPAPVIRAALLRGDLDAIVATCCSPDPRQRYPSVDALKLDVERTQRGEAISVRGDERFYSASRFVRRHRVAVMAAVALVVLLLAFAVTLTLQLRTVSRERDRANRETEKAHRVTTFLIDLFQGADPRESRGAQVTARDLLDRAAARVEQDLSSDPVQQTELMAVMADIYDIVGAAAEAERLSRASLERREQTLGPDAEETLGARADWVNRLRSSGKCREAEKAAHENWERASRVLGPEHTLTLVSLWSVAVSQICDGRPREAIPALRTVVEANRRLRGPDAERTLAALNALASAVGDEGQDAEAASLFEEVLASRRRVLGADHPDTLDTLNDLANVRFALRELDQTEALLNELVPAFRRVLGPENPKTLNALRHQADLFAAQGRLIDAEAQLRAVLETQRRLLSADHQYVMLTMGDLGMTLAMQGRFAEQEQVHQEALALEQRARSQPSPCGLELHYWLAASAALKGDLPASLEHVGEIAKAEMTENFVARFRRDASFKALWGRPEFEALMRSGRE